MPVKITDLPQATLPLGGTEPMEIVQNGESRQVASSDVAGTTPPLDSTYVTVTLNATLTNERVLAVGSNLDLVDGGANGNITVSMADMVQATVKGRASGAGTGAPTDLTAAQLATILGTVGFGYLTLTATDRVIGSDAGSANIADRVIIMGQGAADAMADTDFAGSIVMGVQAWGRSTGARANAPAVVIGDNAQFNNTSNASGENVIIGPNALESSVADNTNACIRNVVIGFQAGQQTADNPTSNATLIGYRAGRCNTANGFVNANGAVYIGSQAGENQQSGVNNTAIGTSAMSLGAITGNENTCVGQDCGTNISSGSRNTCVGQSAGNGLGTQDDNVLIGEGITVAVADAVIVGQGATAAANQIDQIVIGRNAGLSLTANPAHFVIESSTSVGANLLSYLYGRLDQGNLALGQANDGAGLPINRDFGGGAPINVLKIHDTSSAPNAAATAGVIMWSASGLLNFFGGMQNRGETYFLGIVEPATLGAGTTNNWAPTLTGATRVRFDGPAAADVTGLAGGTDGRYLILTNDGANAITFRDEDAGSTAGNRFAFNGDILVGADESFTIIYDGSISRWTRLNNA